MRVLYISITPIVDINVRGIYTDLLREFIKNGHQLTVFSPQPKTNALNAANEDLNIQYINVGSLTKVHPVRKIINYQLFSLKSILRFNKLANEQKFDLVLYSTPPIQLKAFLKRIKSSSNAFFYLMLKDIFPQNAVDLGMIPHSKLSVLLRYYYSMERELYQLSDTIGCMSQANVDFLIDRHPTTINKLEILPNASDTSSIPSFNSNRQHLLGKYKIPTNKTISIFGGNLGKPQGIDYIISVLELNETIKDSHIVIVGNGTEFNKLNEFFQSRTPQNSTLIKELSKIEFDELLFHCEIGLLFLDYRFTIPNFPSRILSYFEFAKPVLAATDEITDIRDLLTNESLGVWVPSNNPAMFIQELTNLINDENRRLSMGLKARKYLEKYWTSAIAYDIIVSNLEGNQ